AAVVASGKCIESERQALLSLKRGFNARDDDDWLSSWGDGEQQKECCNWEGVTCSNHTGHVLMLHLQGDGYTRGSISPSLGELHHLKYLDLSGHHFTHTPSIPPFIASLTFLTHLDLFSCSFGGNIPPQLGNLLFLEYLDLSSNNLVGGFPLQLTNMSSLTYLDLSHNSLNETMPPQLGNLLSLEHLDLSANAFTGTIPSQFKNLSRLQYLDLHYWDKTMSLSSDLQWLSELSTMRYLSLPRVNLSGLISEAHFSRLSHLGTLDLSHNALAFNVSVDWIPPFNLTNIYLARCKLGPDFPTWLHTQTMIEYLDISCAGISSTVPNWFWERLPFMMYLNISHNRGNNFSGKIPSSLHNCTQLQIFYAARNKLSGTIPSWIGDNIPKLLVLSLHSNNFHGNIPLSMCNLDELRVLDLSLNILSGSIPKCISNL
ncbi:hypothetical protein S245_049767, partial [Arachis hypogaea]